MKIKKSTLKTIIKEEIENLRKEVTDDDAIMKARQRGIADYMKDLEADQDEEATRDAAMKEFAGNAKLIDAYEDRYEEAHYDYMEKAERDLYYGGIDD